MFLRIYLEESLKWLEQERKRLWGSLWVQRTVRLLVVIIVTRCVVRLVAGQIDWTNFLDDLAINLIASLLLSKLLS